MRSAEDKRIKSGNMIDEADHWQHRKAEAGDEEEEEEEEEEKEEETQPHEAEGRSTE